MGCHKQYQLDQVQQIQLVLLKEIDSFCEVNNIKYSLAGPSVIDYLRNGCVTEKYYDFQLMMTPRNFNKFESLIAKSLPNNRGIEGRINNPYFTNRSVWYFDKNTLFYDPARSSRESGSIRVVISPMKPVLKRRSVTKHRDSKSYRQIEKLKKRLALLPDALQQLVTPIHKVQAKRNNLDWLTYLEVGDQQTTEFRHTVKSLKCVFKVQAAWSEQTSRIVINGVSLNVFKSILENPKGLISNYEAIAIRPFTNQNVLISPFTSFNQFQKCIPPHQVRRYAQLTRKQLKLAHKIKKSEESEFSAVNENLKIALSVQTIKVKHSLEPFTDELSKLQSEGKIESTAKILKKYKLLFLYFFEHGKLMIFDQKIFAMLMTVIRYEGNADLADRVERMLESVERNLP